MSLVLSSPKGRQRAKINGERIANYRKEGKSFEEIAVILGYSPGYCQQLLNFSQQQEVQGSEPTDKPLISQEKFSVDDTGLVTYLYMNRVLPDRFDYKPGTNFVFFEYTETRELQQLVDAFYDSASVAACEFSRASRYVFSLMKRFQRGEKVSF